MSANEVDRAVQRVAARRPELGVVVAGVADALTVGEGVAMIHQAALQEYLWWRVPRDYLDDEWPQIVEAAVALLEELGLSRLAALAGSATTVKVLAAWGRSQAAGGAAFRDARDASGVEPPDTEVLAWGSIMGLDEARARDTVERALGDAVDCGQLVPGAPRWRARAAAITDATLTTPVELPPGQTLVGLVTTERVGMWIAGAHHRTLGQWRADVANRLLHPVEPPGDAASQVAPMLWLLELAAASGGAALTANNYLARASVLAAVERFGWWEWGPPPHSEANVHQLATLREAASRRHWVRRRGRRLHITTRGAPLVDSPGRLWDELATETEDGGEYTRMLAELVGLRLLRGRVEWGELDRAIAPILHAQGWTSSAGPITDREIRMTTGGPLRWWRIFGVLDEEESTWERGTGRRLRPHTIGLSVPGERWVLAYLRNRAAGPRHRVSG